MRRFNENMIMTLNKIISTALIGDKISNITNIHKIKVHLITTKLSTIIKKKKKKVIETR